MGFDITTLKQIPVLEIAARLGIQTIGSKAMCFKNHDKKTPSLSFNHKRNFWYCFGCGEGGDGIRLVQQYLNLDFKNACSWLSDEFGLSGSKYKNLEKEAGVKAKYHPILQPKPNSYRADWELYEWLVNSSSLSETGCRYLVEERQFSHKTLDYFNITDLKNPYDKFITAQKKWGIERLLRCGLAKQKEKGKISFVWWDHVILFPFYDLQGRVIYVQGRRLEPGDPRYVNLIGVKTELFNWRILNHLKQGAFVYICEGVTDVLSAHQVELNAVGIIGANNFREEWANRFKDFRVRVIPDVDSAGSKLSSSIREAFRKIGKSVETVKLGKGKDFSEFICLARMEWGSG
jgi:DNA primase